jgi:predicted  nucleic acid-binding Zn-ribbon protein
MKHVKTLETESFSMKLEINRLKDLEISCKNSKILISELEEINKSLNNRLRIAKQKELEFDQVQYEKSVMSKEISKFSEEVAQKDKMIMDLQQTLSFEQMQSNSCLEDLLLKEKTTKSELEMAKIELKNYKSELKAVERSKKDLEEKLASLSKKVLVE